LLAAFRRRDQPLDEWRVVWQHEGGVVLTVVRSK
jgi:hypothetical protein